MIHATAIVDPTAEIADDVIVGAYSIIGPRVKIDSGSWIGPHVVIAKNTTIGKHNKIYQFASIGEDTQDKKFLGEEVWLHIGDHNTIREHVTISRGTQHGLGYTKIGDHNLLMAATHIAHDCIVSNHCTMANYAALAGHVTLEDHVGLGGYAGIHQFCRIGTHSFIGMSSAITKDVAPFVLVSGHEAKVYGLNQVGLRRRGFDAQQLEILQKAYKIVFRSQLTVEQSIAQLQTTLQEHNSLLQPLLKILHESTRGIVR